MFKVNKIRIKNSDVLIGLFCILLIGLGISSGDSEKIFESVSTVGLVVALYLVVKG